MTKTIDAYKAQAKRLRTALAERDITLSHGHALEAVARQHGFRDWNTLTATGSARSDRPFQVGDRVTGIFMKRPFTGTVIGVQLRAKAPLRQTTFKFDAPVDIADSDRFHVWRHRVTVTLDPDGRSTNAIGKRDGRMAVKWEGSG